jgi:hypothetical protein
VYAEDVRNQGSSKQHSHSEQQLTATGDVVILRYSLGNRFGLGSVRSPEEPSNTTRARRTRRTIWE